MELKIYQVDAFANKAFDGNPAAVCPLDEWLSDELMQSIAAENNLSETTFFVEDKNGFHIRWFTPTCEVDLCGHATLAAAFVIFEMFAYKEVEIKFESKSGLLVVKQHDEFLEMDFPSQAPIKCEIPKEITAAFNDRPIECLKSEDYIVVFENETSVLHASPDLALLSELDLRGVVITSQSNRYDFVSRFFAPKYGIDEDPVTGSSFTQLAPYWAGVLNKTELKAKQVSKRGGEVACAYLGERVKISGKAVLYLEGVIKLG